MALKSCPHHSAVSVMFCHVSPSVAQVPKWLLPKKSRPDQKEEEYGQEERTKETEGERWNSPRKRGDAVKRLSNCTRKGGNKLETGRRLNKGLSVSGRQSGGGGFWRRSRLSGHLVLGSLRNLSSQRTNAGKDQRKHTT